ncbi:MAG: hypothetical protein US35_C0003G0007 [Parcubacteria group bacterium GW2011_GWA2_37_10]|nr:MAG: hypothetical protein US35_C0003G0007 [Parcubacteria group bacterium GW2011_GWA2_37_10]
MQKQKNYNIKRCNFCNKTLDKIWFTALMTEEWRWNGTNWECDAKHSLTTDSEQNVVCPNYGRVAGKGIDFGF